MSDDVKRLQTQTLRMQRQLDDLASRAATEAEAMEQRVAALETAVADLTQRVTNLEAAAPEEPEEYAGLPDPDLPAGV